MPTFLEALNELVESEVPIVAVTCFGRDQEPLPYVPATGTSAKDRSSA